jgi:Rrf2 family cysteine metabolism transcriptional repressor
MKISTRSEYAAKALLYLALAEEERKDRRPAQIPAIAHDCDIPLKYLEQILVVLRNHGVLASRRGVAGGYFLLRPPDDLTIGEVVRLMDGSSSIASNLPDCGPSDPICESIRALWVEVDSVVASTLDNVTLGQLREQVKAARAKKDLSSLMFYI